MSVFVSAIISVLLGMIWMFLAYRERRHRLNATKVSSKTTQEAGPLVLSALEQRDLWMEAHLRALGSALVWTGVFTLGLGAGWYFGLLEITSGMPRIAGLMLLIPGFLSVGWGTSIFRYSNSARKLMVLALALFLTYLALVLLAGVRWVGAAAGPEVESTSLLEICASALICAASMWVVVSTRGRMVCSRPYGNVLEMYPDGRPPTIRSFIFVLFIAQVAWMVFGWF